MARRKVPKAVKRGAQIGAMYGLQLTRLRRPGFEQGAKSVATASAVGAGVGLGIHGAVRSYKHRKGNNMSKGSWAGGRAPAQGSAGVPQKSKAVLGHGFTTGITNANKRNQGSGIPPVNNGASSRPRKGVWHPMSERP